MVTETPADQQFHQGFGLAVLVGALLFGQFLQKPVHIDDANFLQLAVGAAHDFRRPHLIPINWNGRTVPAFDVLSNPPGIAWWLVPVLNCPIWVQHLWMLVWLLPTAWGARELGRYFCHDDGSKAVWVLLTCPVVVLSAQSLLPDLPMLACTVAGLGGFVSKKGLKEFWAFVAGSAYLFRYSGCLIIPVLLVMAWRQSRWRGVVRCWPAVVPMLALMTNDFLVYGKWHLLAMFAFQNHGYQKTPDTVVHNMVAAIGMLGGACVLPILVWQRGTKRSALVGAWIGLNMVYMANQPIAMAIPTVAFAAAGATVLYLMVGPKSREASLSLWGSLGLLLMWTSRFAATRYWIPFLPAFVLLGLRCRNDRRSCELAIAANILLSLGMAIDDFEFAECQRQAALYIASVAPEGQFAGHWGWQYYLEAHGWTPLEAGGTVSGFLASSAMADPQTPSRAECLVEVGRFTLPDRWPGPRTHCRELGATYHGGGRGAYAPWTLTNEPYDFVTLWRSCRMDQASQTPPDGSSDQ